MDVTQNPPQQVREEEGRKVRELFETKFGKGGKSALAKKLKEEGRRGSAGLFSQHMAGFRPINEEWALVYSDWLQVPVEQFSERLADALARKAVAAQTQTSKGATQSQGQSQQQVMDLSDTGSPDGKAPNRLTTDNTRGGSSVQIDRRSESVELRMFGIGPNSPTIAVGFLESDCVSNNKHTLAGFPVSAIVFNPDWLTSFIGATAIENIRLSINRSNVLGQAISVGDLMLIDTGVKSVRGPGIYLYRMHGSESVARFIREIDGSIRGTFDNANYSPIHINDDAKGFEIVGSVVYVWKGMIP